MRIIERIMIAIETHNLFLLQHTLTNATPQERWIALTHTDSRQYTPLMHSIRRIRHNNIAIARALLRSIRTTNNIEQLNILTHIGRFGNTALILSAHRGQTQLFQEILQAIIAVHPRPTEVLPLLTYTDQYGYSALIGAARFGHTTLISTLLVQMKIAGATPLMILETLMSVDQYQNTALILATKYDHIDTAIVIMSAIEATNCYPQVLLGILTHPSEIYHSPLILSVQRGHTQLFDLYLHTINHSRGTPDEILQALNHPGRYRETALLLAIKHDKLDMVKAILEAIHNSKAPPSNQLHALNCPGSYGYTALMLAAQGGYVEVTRLLLRSILKVCTQTEYLNILRSTDHHCNPLLLAAHNGYTTLLQDMLSIIIDPEDKKALLIQENQRYTRSQNNALSLLARSKNQFFLQWLFNEGVYLNSMQIRQAQGDFQELQDYKTSRVHLFIVLKQLVRQKLAIDLFPKIGEYLHLSDNLLIQAAKEGQITILRGLFSDPEPETLRINITQALFKRQQINNTPALTLFMNALSQSPKQETKQSPLCQRLPRID